VEMWTALRDWLDKPSTKLGRAQVLQKFTASQPSRDETVTQVFTTLITFPKKRIGTTKDITDDAIKTHIFTTLSNSYETTIHMLQQRIHAPTAQQCMDAICEYPQRTTLTKVFGDASTGAALYTSSGNHGHGGWGAERGGRRGHGR
jgi:hypothetical protein